MAPDTGLGQLGLRTLILTRWWKDSSESFGTEARCIANCNSIGHENFTLEQTNLTDKTVDLINFFIHHEPWKQVMVVMHYKPNHDVLVYL